jgi:endonuclease YncB( thermonuclease family)
VGPCCTFAQERAAEYPRPTKNLKDVVVERVIDGDSLMTRHHGKMLEIRLWGIDAPEYDQPGAERATRTLERLTGRKKIALSVVDQDKYGRTVALVRAGNTLINEEMVRSGNSWVHRFYCRAPICDDWLEYERQARQARLGLWNEEPAVAPWRWKSAR